MKKLTELERHPTVKAKTVRVLQRALGWLEKEPRRFDMHTWRSHSDLAPCGTAACLAGAICLSTPRLRKQAMTWQAVCPIYATMPALASKELGMREGIVSLFHKSEWDDREQRMYGETLLGDVSLPNQEVNKIFSRRLRALRMRLCRFVTTGR